MASEENPATDENSYGLPTTPGGMVPHHASESPKMGQSAWRFLFVTMAICGVSLGIAGNFSELGNLVANFTMLASPFMAALFFLAFLLSKREKPQNEEGPGPVSRKRRWLLCFLLVLGVFNCVMLGLIAGAREWTADFFLRFYIPYLWFLVVFLLCLAVGFPIAILARRLVLAIVNKRR